MKTFFSAYPYCPFLRKNRSKSLAEQFKIETEVAAELEGHPHDLAVVRAYSSAQILMLNKLGTDYFIENEELLHVLLWLAKDYSPSVLDVFAEAKRTAFLIHPPSPSPAVLVKIETDNEGQTNCFVMWWEQQKFKAVYISVDSLQKKERLTCDCYGDRLAVSLALYLRFFPHAAKDGIPDSAKHPAHYKGRPCVRVGLVEDLIDRSGPTPHIRAAHVRVLQHPRFTHKQGQEVWVKASFVAGKSKFVCEVEGDIKGRIKA